MLGWFDRFARSWVSGLAETLIRAIDRMRPPARFGVRQNADRDWILSASDSGDRHSEGPMDPVGVLPVTDTVALEAMHRVLKGAEIRIEIPSDWVLRRTLDPVPKQTAAYLEAFVRHHIERVTPWRAADTHHAAFANPVAGDPERISVSLAVTPRNLVETVVAAIEACHPGRLTLVTHGEATKNDVSIDVSLAKGGAQRRRVRIETLVGVTIGILIVALVAGVGAASWYRSALEGQRNELDGIIAEQRAFLNAVSARRGLTRTFANGPEALRAAGTPVVARIETLSALLPDHAYLTELHQEADHIRIAGISRDVAGLIPTIERSGSFTEVSFFAPTTRLPGQDGDRFFIEMRIRSRADLPASGAGAP
ncbi:hypothetical protein ASF60_14960 [Methylobacterium sp. Leaf113]|uniref:PilN domain-containing protein n=1 Tax=Methylobacterium sp. Leaf113 TaxID=1736259 RepID=UPI0006F951EB|nr:PilN domain-containing protein [Methylobacterium sp. Leaf113]KQP93242.1 hypothetical protein ASF60_14960 [Methylobacterium sp. Leaf113]